MRIGLCLIFALMSFTVAAQETECERYEIAYIDEDESGRTDIFIIDVFDKAIRRATDDDLVETDVDWSPNGEDVVVVASHYVEGEFDSSALTIIEVDSAARQTIFDTGRIINPKWSPNGMQIAFHSTADGLLSAYLINVDGSNLIRFDTGIYSEALAWSPNGRYLAIEARDETMDIDIYLANIDTGNVARLEQPETADFAVSWMSENIITFHANGEFRILNPFSERLQAERFIPVEPVPIDTPFRWSPIAWSPIPESHEAVFVYKDDIWLYQNGTLSNLTQSRQDVLWTEWSPDGRFIAYSSRLYESISPYGIKILEVDTGDEFTLLEDIYEADWRPC